MDIFDVLTLLGGIAMFLFGMTYMGDSLKKLAGSQMKAVLTKVTSNPFTGFLLGMGVTMIIQSSTATNVMILSFVNAGMLSLTNAIPLVIGANLGTTITAWIISLSSIDGVSLVFQLLKPSSFTPIVIFIGVILYRFTHKAKKQDVGAILIGFALLMYGMTAMSDAVSPLRESEAFIALLTRFSNPVLGILVGVVFTAIIQSSAAAVGILQALSMTGALSFSAAYPIILGIAVGGALPVLISALGASLNARRTALVHLIIDVLGALFCGAVFYAVNAAHPLSVMDHVMSPVSVAALNTVLRVATVVVLTPAIGLMEKMARFFIKDEPEPEQNSDWDLLEDRFIQHPALAIEQCRIVLTSMAEHVQKNIADALSLLRDYSAEGFAQVQDTEELVDQYEDKLGTYIVQITDEGAKPAEKRCKAQHKTADDILANFTDAEIDQRARTCGDTDHGLDGVVGRTGHRNHFITRAQYAEQRDSQRMGAAQKVLTRQGVLRVKNIGVDLIERISAAVVIAVACRAGKHRLADVVFLKRLEHFLLVKLFDPLDLFEMVAAQRHRLVGGGAYFVIEFK